ncbi:hypothetical protein ILUMI_08464 [Ignelater luminosus]|uniref:Peptidase S1 domain-containing protein n=1 Tax=Ignelater luminosus TaxID=2038154 RepID=A0A8K0D4C2_IGNLU|nr:hypothetical protein ILUMI_08464 [Ignelater luminosus]
MELILIQIILVVTCRVTPYHKIKRGRIVDGENATAGQFPYMISLSIVVNQTVMKHLCGGTILTTSWSVTAAHCIDDEIEILIKYKYIKMVGNTLIYTKNYKQHDIDCYEIHPKFGNEFGNDIALIRVEQPFNGHYEKAIALPPSNFKYVIGTKVIIIGWGHLDQEGTKSDLLRYTEVRLIDDFSCKRAYQTGKTRELNSDIMVCAGDDTHKNTACFGDSGGPLIQESNQSGESYQIGITSFGRNCIPFPVVFTRITAYLDWINDIQCRHESSCKNNIFENRNT